MVNLLLSWTLGSALFLLCQAATIKAPCTLLNAEVRKEWSDMRVAERIAYTSAVNCLVALPSKLDHAKYPGAKSRYDDFVALHINGTLRIHFSGTFLPWHRQFVRIYDAALRQECGYRGVTPYWDWTRYIDDMYNNKLFDGSSSSMSGDGLFNPNNQPVIAGTATVPVGKGGGCIASGPFKNLTHNLGPVSNDAFNLHGILPANAFRYNPRCLVRDLHPTTLAANCNKTIVDRLVTSKTIVDFLFNLQTNSPFGAIPLVNNPHGGGHFSWVGGTSDLFDSPSDPIFFLHHAQVDRMWAKWQALDPKKNQNALNGTNTVFNDPPSALTMLQDTLEMGIESTAKIGNIMNIMGGELCYYYQEPLAFDVDHV